MEVEDIYTPICIYTWLITKGGKLLL
jgi:hypothetical protein